MGDVTDAWKTSLKATARVGVSGLTRRRRRIRFVHAVAAARGPVCVNIGAGGMSLEGWLNTDTSWRAPMYLDLTRPWPIPVGSVDYVYADNVIEHFPLEVARVVLRHVFTAMRPGGRVRLATPDAERNAQAYLHDPNTAAEIIDRHRENGYIVQYPVDVLRVIFSESGHHEGYLHDLQTLSTELTLAGFEGVGRFEVGESDDAVLKGLESRCTDADTKWMLVVEAVKPLLA